VRPGDELRIETEVLAIKPSRSKPNQAVVTVRTTTINQNDEPVQILTAKLFAFSRP
jgi:acyl dehydratase